VIAEARGKCFYIEPDFFMVLGNPPALTNEQHGFDGVTAPCIRYCLVDGVEFIELHQTIEGKASVLVQLDQVRDEALRHRVAGDLLKEIVNEVAKEVGVEVLDIEVMPDHVHLLCEVDPQFGIAKFVRMVKGRTSHHLRREFPALRSRLPTLWTNSWFVATVGGASLAIIERYIKEQKKFTRNLTTTADGRQPRPARENPDLN
jgi:putative transposase